YVHQRRWRELAIATAIPLAVVVVAILPVLDAPLVDMLRYHGERPIQVESTWGAIRSLFGGTPEVTYGSLSLVAPFDGPLRTLASILPIAAWLALVGLAIRRRIDERQMIRFICVAIVAYMILGKVFSPQYLTWLVPIGAV